eukprot:8865432-Ditylum_brightwellii.AAC.1
MSVCNLASKQKYSVLCQGITTISDMEKLGPELEDIRSTFKVFISLSDGKGGVNFGGIHYQRILALVMYAKDKKRKWKYWSLQRFKMGSQGVPLAYVVRKDAVPITFANDQEQLIYEA